MRNHSNEQEGYVGFCFSMTALPCHSDWTSTVCLQVWYPTNSTTDWTCCVYTISTCINTHRVLKRVQGYSISCGWKSLDYGLEDPCSSPGPVLLQGFQHFKKTKYPDFSLMKSQNSIIIILWEFDTLFSNFYPNRVMHISRQMTLSTCFVDTHNVLTGLESRFPNFSLI